MAKIKNKIKRRVRSIFPGNSPDFMIIGAQKSGTSSLHYYLKQHPNLTGSSPKEIHYFDKRIYFDYSLKWYENHFVRKSFKKQLYFESTPNYLYHPEIASTLKQLYPELKFIIVLRNPTSRAYSAWNMYKNIVENGNSRAINLAPKPGERNPIYKYLLEGRNDFPSFEEVINIELDLIKNNKEVEPAILRRGLYAQQFKKYLEHFDIDDFKIIGFKDLILNTDKVLESVYDFLEIRRIPMENLNLEPSNSKPYEMEMNNEIKLFLNKFYEEPNKELFKLLNRELNW
jgi:hypothetical protein